MMTSGMMRNGYPDIPVTAAPVQTKAPLENQEKAALEAQVKNLENQLEQETATLKDQIKIMADQLEQIKEQLKSNEA